MKILIVEDDPASRLFLSEVMKGLRHDVAAAEDGKIGLEVFDKFKPDLVFSDIRMPNMDGLELLARIRKLSSDAIVVMTTAFGSEEYTVKALRLRANDYLLKPIRREDLLGIIQKYSTVVASRTLESEILGKIVRRESTIKIDNRLDLVGKIADRLMLDTGNAISKKDRLGVHLGLVELLMNAMEHGNLEITYEEKTAALEAIPDAWMRLLSERLSQPTLASRIVTIDFKMNQEICEWIITDEGNGFNWKSLPDPLAEENLLESHGRGIMLSRMQFDEFQYIGNGNTVHVKKKTLTPEARV